jgi:hypothetical protein
MATVKLLDGTLVDSSSPEWQAECLEINGSAVAIRRMSHEMQVHAYETLARDRGQDYADRVRRANSLTRDLLQANGLPYSAIRGGDK